MGYLFRILICGKANENPAVCASQSRSVTTLHTTFRGSMYEYYANISKIAKLFTPLLFDVCLPPLTLSLIFSNVSH